MPTEHKMSRGANRAFRISVLVLVTFSFMAIPLSAQQPPMVALALKTTEVISKAHQKSVVVADFWSPKGKLTKLGQTLADQFSTELTGLGKFHVRDREILHEAIRRYSLSFLALRDIDIARWMGQESHTKVIVLGNLEPINDQFKLTVSIYTVPGEKNLGNFEVTMPPAANWQSLFQAPAEGPNATGRPKAGEHGYTVPKCDHCPFPPYSDTALQHRVQGVVVLSVIVGLDGKLHDIAVARNLGFGLDENAVKAVNDWKLSPSIGPNGKPAGVRMLLEVEFRLY